MSHLRARLVLIAVGLLLAVLVWGQGGRLDHGLSVSNVIAVPVVGEDGALRVFLTLANTGGPDRLIAVQSPLAAEAGLVLPPEVSAIPVPSGSSPILAADGAHILLQGLSGAAQAGALVPLTLIFDQAGEVTTRATVSAPLTPGRAAEAGLLGLGDICTIGPGEPAPQLDLSVRPRPDGAGWEIEVMTTDFTFAAPVDGIGHLPGYGHGHLYLDGVKLQRLYRSRAEIGALPPGPHVITVTLNTNDHRAYVVDEQPVSHSRTIASD
ncbi:copper chaperone PCu(A)C [Pseudoruegeria sp. SK021]|uniref:copper chaperone PCu(A)C n=1 Tax=Pseudoruegeria sp. SK021 TaxID=1933035 RepID=UPI000A266668|nr:copper chaperone PCu(A)C [Pseudoruegeria sp. SK021]OSP55875.1 hypothetical protein BV911_05760 [Pseudoruegeria sp. SK021]